jgi:S-disulfanyl-L-cysteine oxidoreductase SoxD
MRILRLASACVLLLWGCIAPAQSTYGIGNTPTEEEIIAFDIDISPTGEGLPEGRGNAKEGAQLYMMKGCIGCHGVTLTEGPAPRLLKADKGPNVDPWEFGKILPIRSPYAPTVWDYINRAMPLGAEGTLAANEVYALVAFLLYKNEVIEEDEIMDAQSLPKVQMPNHENWAPLPDYKPGMDRLEGYPY